MDETEAEEALTGIVVGVDGSPLSIEALRWAARLEPTVGGPITAAGLLLGSVSAACAEHADCPVLVVHTPEDSKAGPSNLKAAAATTASS
ncbi:universal stress protein [Sinomonas humi]|nr:universal stress protein [Sinomonas humi]